MENEDACGVLSRVSFRYVSPTDIPTCLEIELASYPEDEAASLTSLQYRQHHAAKYFRCAVLDSGAPDDTAAVIGFICATRCKTFQHETMTTHESSGNMLAIHSVVISEQYRRQGIATAMLQDYLQEMKRMHDGVDKIVLLAKAHLLGFYVQSGFSVIRPSDIVHGQQLWYHCEMDVRVEKGRSQGRSCWVVDAFTDKGGTGNPAGVVLLSGDADLESLREWMQTVAKEFNLSETAFVWPIKQKQSLGAKGLTIIGERQKQKEEEEEEEEKAVSIKPNPYDTDDNGAKDSGQQVLYSIRYFTCNGTEIDLCGHATLASAAVLFAHLPFKVKNDVSIVFQANKDRLEVKPYAEGTKSWTKNGKSMPIKMDFPWKNVKELAAEDRASVEDMLKRAFPDRHLETVFVGLDQDGGDLLIEVTEDTLDAVGYACNILYRELNWPGYNRGVILCSTSSKTDLDFQSRFFAPKAGINEDPVTGSAHCTLAPYFGSKLGKSSLRAAQISERGGTVRCILSDQTGRVTLIGSAVTVMSGSVRI